MSFFQKLFGKSKAAPGEEVVNETLKGLIDVSGLDLDFSTRSEGDEKIHVEFHGGDQELLLEREGQLLDALQFYVKRVLQHHNPETKVDVLFDADGFRDESNQALIDLAEKLKTVVIEKNRSVYCRALPPKDRRVIHQYLAGDDRVKSRSVGEGLYKKIKIFPANQNSKRASEGLETVHAAD